MSNPDEVAGSVFDQYDAGTQLRDVDEMDLYVHPENYELYYNFSAGDQDRVDAQYDIYDAGDQDRVDSEYDIIEQRSNLLDDF